VREKNVPGKWKIPTIILGVLALIGWRYAQSADPGIGASTQEAMAIGTDTYIYGYPLVTMEMTPRVMTNVDAPTGQHAPIGAVRVVAGVSYRSFSRCYRSER
jgi:hypothetical protein